MINLNFDSYVVVICDSLCRYNLMAENPKEYILEEYAPCCRIDVDTSKWRVT